MCGIVGQARSDGHAVDPGLVQAMCAGLEHRGPDARGVHVEGQVGLGIQRLRVIDLDTGDQPVYNEDRSVAVVLNGEIYNYRELRRRLIANGHRFASDGDTEVIAHLYEEEGAEFVHSLAGMFAVAIWDARQRGTADRPRPARQEAAVLRRARGGDLLRLRALGTARRQRDLPRARPRGARSLLYLHLRAEPFQRFPRGAQAAARHVAALAPGQTPDRALLAARVRPEARRWQRGRGWRAGPRGPALGGQAAHGGGRPARRLPLRRRRLDRGRRGDGRAVGRAGEDLLDRLRGRAF